MRYLVAFLLTSCVSTTVLDNYKLLLLQKAFHEMCKDHGGWLRGGTHDDDRYYDIECVDNTELIGLVRDVKLEGQ